MSRPSWKHRFRPQRSVSLPPGIMSAAITSRKIVIATCTPWTLVSRSWLMSVIITFMFEPAKLQMNCASASGTSTLRRAAGVRSPLTASVTPSDHVDATGAVVELVVEVHRRVDQREVRERLREVPELFSGQADLLREETHVVGMCEHLLENQPRIFEPA